MNLDFIFFPAPKETTNKHEQGQILWIPKYQKLYPNFLNYVPRTNKKRKMFFKQAEQEGDEDEQMMDEQRQKFHKYRESQLKQIQNLQLKPVSCRGRKRQHTDSSSPLFDSNEASPNISKQLEKLNLQSAAIIAKKPTLFRMSSQLYPPVPVTKRESQFYSQPLIKIPTEVLNQKSQEMKEDTIAQKSHQVIGHIPCMYVDSQQHSPNILIYFHANCEDITESYNFLLHLRDNLQISLIAVEYPGYGKYKNETPSAESIQNDAEYVYNYLTKRLGYNEQNIIIFGRSIGSGPATYLASKYKPACLALMSPFTSLQAAVRDYIGSWAQFLIRQRFNNLDYIKLVEVPIYILHGKKDNIIPYSQALELQKTCQSKKCIVHLAENMNHIQYKLHKDLINPFTEFLIEIQYYQHCSSGPKLPTNLFYDPTVE